MRTKNSHWGRVAKCFAEVSLYGSLRRKVNLFELCGGNLVCDRAGLTGPMKGIMELLGRHRRNLLRDATMRGNGAQVGRHICFSGLERGELAFQSVLEVLNGQFDDRDGFGEVVLNLLSISSCLGFVEVFVWEA